MIISDIGESYLPDDNVPVVSGREANREVAGIVGLEDMVDTALHCAGNGYHLYRGKVMANVVPWSRALTIVISPL